jgi:FAD/FMN-containing dehydrogenase
MVASEKEILKSLQQMVGSENIITDKEDLEKYGSDQSFVRPLNPLYAVKPVSQEEVQNIILLANQEGVSVVPYSSGTNLQGAHIPNGKAITLDLSRMNKIHLIDPISRNVILEPGVTFAQLQDELIKQGLRVLTPLGVPSSGSVIGTYLEFTPLFSWPKYGSWETLTMEMVLPNGEVMGTGQMAVKGTQYPYTWTTPYAVVNRIFLGAQGTLGVVTKAAITVKTLHPVAKVFFVSFYDLTTVAEAVRTFLRPELTEEVFFANSHYLSLFLAKEWPEEFNQLKEKSAPWTLVMVVRGEREEVEVKTLDLEEVASSLQLKLTIDLLGITDAKERVLNEIAYPNGYLNQNRLKGAWNPIFCYTTMGNLSSFHDLITTIGSNHKYPSEDIGFLLLPLNHGATFYFEPSFYRKPSDKEESQKVEKLFLEASTRLIQEGAFFDRPYPMWAKEVYARAPNYHSKIKEIKKIFDPNNIMNPGKLAFE